MVSQNNGMEGKYITVWSPITNLTDKLKSELRMKPQEIGYGVD